MGIVKLPYAAECVMVKGNHVVSILVSLIYAAVRKDSVPAFQIVVAPEVPDTSSRVIPLGDEGHMQNRPVRYPPGAEADVP